MKIGLSIKFHSINNESTKCIVIMLSGHYHLSSCRVHTITNSSHQIVCIKSCWHAPNVNSMHNNASTCTQWNPLFKCGLGVFFSIFYGLVIDSMCIDTTFNKRCFIYTNATLSNKGIVSTLSGCGPHAEQICDDKKEATSLTLFCNKWGFIQVQRGCR